MGFDIGAGLSAMGTSVANQAGAYGLAEQRTQLQSQMDVLANQLAEGRQTRVAGVEHGFRTEEAKARMDFDTKRDDQQHGQRMEEIGQGHKMRLDEISASSKARINEAAAERGIAANDLSWIETDDATGTRFGVTKSGKKIDLGITGPNDADEKLLARAERFALVKKSTVDDATGNKTTEDNIDPTKAAEFLTRQGRGDLAKGYETPKAPAVPSLPKGLPAGSQFSPSRQQWRDPDGKLYDLNGAPLSGGSAPKKTAGLINMPMPAL